MSTIAQTLSGAMGLLGAIVLFALQATSRSIERAAKRLGSIDLNQYPTCLSDDLRAGIAREHGLSPEEVLVGNGSDEVLDVVCKTFCNPGDLVAIPTPTFVMYSFFASFCPVSRIFAAFTTTTKSPASR